MGFGCLPDRGPRIRVPDPENVGDTFTPPNVTTGVPNVCDNGFDNAGEPGSGALVTLPRPVQKIATESPGFAGRDPGKAPVGAASDAPINAAACPVP